jgi:hypothetical protein
MVLARPLNSQPIASDLEPAPARELLEFMAGGDPPIAADPDFRDQLRDRLWTIVSKRRPQATPGD